MTGSWVGWWGHLRGARQQVMLLDAMTDPIKVVIESIFKLCARFNQCIYTNDVCPPPTICSQAKPLRIQNTHIFINGGTQLPSYHVGSMLLMGGFIIIRNNTSEHQMATVQYLETNLLRGYSKHMYV